MNLAYQFDLNCIIRQLEEEKTSNCAALKVPPASVYEEGGEAPPSLAIPAFDNNKTDRNHNLFTYAISGYTTGLFLAFACSYIYRVAQPALIYLVPSILTPLVLRAKSKGVLNEVWHGRKENSE